MTGRHKMLDHHGASDDSARLALDKVGVHVIHKFDLHQIHRQPLFTNVMDTASQRGSSSGLPQPPSADGHDALIANPIAEHHLNVVTELLTGTTPQGMDARRLGDATASLSAIHALTTPEQHDTRADFKENSRR